MSVKLEEYPMPKLEDLFEKLSGGEKFSKLDLSHGCLQVILGETPKPYVTINTQKVLFQVNHLGIRVLSSSDIIQQYMCGQEHLAIRIGREVGPSSPNCLCNWVCSIILTITSIWNTGHYFH